MTTATLLFDDRPTIVPGDESTDDWDTLLCAVASARAESDESGVRRRQSWSRPELSGDDQLAVGLMAHVAAERAIDMIVATLPPSVQRSVVVDLVVSAGRWIGNASVHRKLGYLHDARAALRAAREDMEQASRLLSRIA